MTLQTKVDVSVCKDCSHFVQHQMIIPPAYHTKHKKPRILFKYSCELYKDEHIVRTLGYSNDPPNTIGIIFFDTQDNKERFLKDCPYYLENLLRNDADGEKL